jgi:hypothetical protein
MNNQIKCMASLAELKIPAKKICRQFYMLTTTLKQTGLLEVGIYLTCKTATFG